MIMESLPTIGEHLPIITKVIIKTKPISLNN